MQIDVALTWNTSLLLFASVPGQRGLNGHESSAANT